jgi:hypothetical protein
VLKEEHTRHIANATRKHTENDHIIKTKQHQATRGQALDRNRAPFHFFNNLLL